MGECLSSFVVASGDIGFSALISRIAAVLHKQQSASRVVRQQQPLHRQKIMQDVDN
ncbi:hypothetical protein [Aquitalea palustris]|uniref:hypothetical protein n=1 Tax=Aquitalea palustris TaxID=2480983 RepID=UPI001314CCFE|nr:hypothetical protein [Aquitalea palustris]